MEKVRTLWYGVVESLWFIPGLLTLGGGALAIVLVRFNGPILEALGGEDIWWVFGGTPDGAQSVLESISSSIITVTGVVFSVTIVALQLASSQFTPRVLRQFMGDRANQIVLGVFIGTFTFTLLVQRTVRSEDAGEAFVPQVAVTTAVLLALTSIGFLIFFINHVARSIQAAVILDSVAESALQVVGTVFPVERPRDASDGESTDAAGTLPEADDGNDSDDGVSASARTGGGIPGPHDSRPLRLAEPGSTAAAAPALAALGKGAPVEVRARRAGYLQAIQRKKICDVARVHDLRIIVEARTGNYLLPGMVAMRVWPADGVADDLADELAGALVQGLERTPHQDVMHGVLELMDIALKGLSPGINDPTTAVNAIQRMAQVLLELAWREQGDSVERDPDGRPRVVIRRPSLGEMVELAFGQIRHFGASNPAVAITCMNVLAELAALSPPDTRPTFLAQLDAVIGTARDRVQDPEDARRVERAAAVARTLARAA